MVDKEMSLNTDGRVTVWLRKLEGVTITTPVKPFVLDLPALRNIHVEPATEKDDDKTIQWGCMWGNESFEDSPSPAEKPGDLRDHIGSWLDVD